MDLHVVGTPQCTERFNPGMFTSTRCISCLYLLQFPGQATARSAVLEFALNPVEIAMGPTTSNIKYGSVKIGPVIHVRNQQGTSQARHQLGTKTCERDRRLSQKLLNTARPSRRAFELMPP